MSGAVAAAGKYANALGFDGLNDWVSGHDSDSLDLTTGMTLMAWVMTPSVWTHLAVTYDRTT